MLGRAKEESLEWVGLAILKNKMNKKKYKLHPNFIFSIKDNDMHYISSLKLIQLYRVRDTDCKTCYGCATNKPNLCSSEKGLIDLYPDYLGEYKIPEKEL